MNIRSCVDSDVALLVDQTIETLRPFYEAYVGPLLGEDVFRHQHGHWEQDYRDEIPGLHDPAARQIIAIAEIDGAIAGGPHLQRSRLVRRGCRRCVSQRGGSCANRQREEQAAARLAVASR